MSPFGLVSGREHPHPVAECRFDQVTLGHETVIHHHCKNQGIRYLKAVTWTGTGDEGEARDLLRGVRFDVLEDACPDATGEPCPH
jgi:hypothetical protein